MDTLTPAYWVFSLMGIFEAIFTIVVNCFIIRKCTMELNAWKKIDYQLILLRIFFDVLNGFLGLLYYIINIFSFSTGSLSFDIFFLEGLASFSFLEMRSVLAAIIAIERALATILPLDYCFYRRKIPNFSIFTVCFVCGVVAWPIVFNFCGMTLPVTPKCPNFSCVVPTCFSNYSSATRVIYTSINIVFSIILSTKLFLLNIQETKVSHDLRKANLVSLIDGLSILLFELTPAILFNYGIVDRAISGFGPVVGAFRQLGRSIESVVMIILLKKEVVVQPVHRVSVALATKVNEF